MPNDLAYIVLFGWLPAALIFFRVFRPVTAATITLLGAVVVLPANFAIDLQGFPSVDRHVMGGIASLIGYYLIVPQKHRHRRRALWPALLIATQVLCAFISVYTNPDPLHYGMTKLPGLSEYDALGVAFRRLITIGIPFFLGSRLIRSTEDVLSVLRVIVFFGLAYVPLVLWEARMSPQLHANLYGFFPHSFLQHIRSGAFRPLVFTSHGLEAALFMATALIAAVGLWQARLKIQGFHAIVPVVVLLVGLAFCRSLGSMLYGFLVSALIIATRATLQVRLALVISLVVLFYPLLRLQGLFPTQVLVTAAQTVSEERAGSLQFRFKNEDLLLEKAQKRLWLGWGTWGRNRVYNRETGGDESVTDGYWILEIGMFGLTGFLSFFSLLLAPVILSVKRVISMPPGRGRAVVAALILLVVVRTVDLIPNAFPAPFTLFLAGALMQFTVPSDAKRRQGGQAVRHAPIPERASIDVPRRSVSAPGSPR